MIKNVHKKQTQRVTCEIRRMFDLVLLLQVHIFLMFITVVIFWFFNRISRSLQCIGRMSVYHTISPSSVEINSTV